MNWSRSDALIRPHAWTGRLSGPLARLAVVFVIVAALGLAGAAIAAADAGVDITPSEGQPFTGTVATTSCSISTASIDWGDGTPASAGRDNGGDPSGIAGDHTYAEEGVYAATVRYTSSCTRFSIVQFKATVAEAPLTAAGRDLSGAQGQTSQAWWRISVTPTQAARRATSRRRSAGATAARRRAASRPPPEAGLTSAAPTPTRPREVSPPR